MFVLNSVWQSYHLYSRLWWSLPTPNQSLNLSRCYARTPAEIIRYRFNDPKDILIELFSRLTFNVLCGNTDDHARNHAAFWNGKDLSLTSAYDIPVAFGI